MKAKITIQFQIPYTNKFIEKDSILEVINKAPEGAVVYYKEKGFNYSAIINFGVKNSDGEYILQLNNDTEIIKEDWPF